MKIIDFSLVSELTIPGTQLVKWVEDGLEDKENIILPTKISMKPSEEVFYNVMPAIISSKKKAGLKVVNRYPSRVPVICSQIYIYNQENGNLEYIMDGNYITTARTGAVAVHSIKTLAVEDFRVVSFIGLGNQARATLKILLNEYSNRNFCFKLYKYKDQHLKFAKLIYDLSDNNNIVFCDTYEETIIESDVIISSVTYFSSDIIKEPSLFKRGCLLVPIHTRGFMNCDLYFDKIFADDTNHVKNFKNFNNFKFFGEVADVLNGKTKGREDNKERIIAYNIGLALHDINFATNIYKQYFEKQSLPEFNLSSPSSKFWY